MSAAGSSPSPSSSPHADHSSGCASPAPISGPVPYSMVARLFDTQSRRWVRVHLTLALPPTSLEDYDYDPEPEVAGGTEKGAEGEGAGPARAAADPTMWLYIRRAGPAQRRKSTLHASSTMRSVGSPVSSTPPASPTSSPTTASPTAPRAAVAGGQTWVKVKVAQLRPRAAGQPLSSEMRAALQLRLTDSTAMTYSSHGTPRATSLAGTPKVGVTPRDPTLSPNSSQGTSTRTEVYLTVPSSSGTVPQGRRRSAAMAGAAPPISSQRQLCGRGGEGGAAASARSGASSLATTVCGLTVDSMAELYEVELCGTTVPLVGLSPSERRVLTPPPPPPPSVAGKGSRRRRYVRSTSSGSSTTLGEKSTKHRLDYHRVKNHFLSWLTGKKPAAHGLHIHAPTSRGSPPVPGLHRPRVEAAAAAGTATRRNHARGSFAEPLLSSPLILPLNSHVTLRLRFYKAADHLVLLRWFVWARHTRESRRRRAREGRAAHQRPSYVSYHPADIAREEAATSDEDGMGLCRSDSRPIASLGPASVDHRWEDYVRRSRDPRNDLPLAAIPPLLWYSFLPLAPLVLYRCERGFLAVEATDSGGGERGGGEEGVLSPLRAARRVRPRGRGGASDAGPLTRRASWDTVNLIITSPGETPMHASRTHGPPSPAVSPPQLPAPAPRGGSSAPPLSLGTAAPGAQFRDCFLCLTESHLVFYNSFAELKVHVSLDHVCAVLFSHPCPSPTRLNGAGADTKDSCAGSHELPQSYPFVCFRIRAGIDELSEPPLLVTFTFLPLVPHASSDSLAQDTPSEERHMRRWHTPPPPRADHNSPPHHTRDHTPSRDGEHSEQDSHSEGEEDEEADAAQVRRELRALRAAQARVVEILRVLTPNASQENIDFDAYVHAVRAERRRRAAQVEDGDTLSRSAGAVVPFVAIHPSDIVAQPARSTSPTPASMSQSTTAATRGHGLRPSPGLIHVLSGGTLSAMDVTDEHRRLRDVLSASSSLSRSALPGSAPAAACTADMERISDFDLTVRMASHPLPLMLEREDLFLDPLSYQVSHEGSGLQSASEARLALPLRSGGVPGVESTGSASDSERVGRERRPSAGVRTANGAQRSVSTSAAAAGSEDLGSPFAAVRPKKRPSTLNRARKAPR